MELQKMKGIVLRELPFGEADKLLIVLSDTHGRISVSAKGAKKPGSRFLAAAQPFAYSEMELGRGKSMYILRNAELLDPFFNLRNDLDTLTAASNITRLTARIVQEELPDPDTLRLLLKALSLLDKGGRNPQLIASIFSVRLLKIQGMISALSDLELQGKDNLMPGTKAAFSHVCTAPDEKLFAFSVSDTVNAEFANLAEALTRRYFEL